MEEDLEFTYFYLFLSRALGLALRVWKQAKAFQRGERSLSRESFSLTAEITWQSLRQWEAGFLS